MYFIHDALKRLRNAHTDKQATRVFWRGMKNVTMSQEFEQRGGGTELACASTSSSLEHAIKFGKSEQPFFFKIESKDAISRGADIAFLSVFPKESEVLYPPLTYWRLVSVGEEQLGDLWATVAVVEPTI